MLMEWYLLTLCRHHDRTQTRMGHPTAGHPQCLRYLNHSFIYMYIQYLHLRFLLCSKGIAAATLATLATAPADCIKVRVLFILLLTSSHFVDPSLT